MRRRRRTGDVFGVPMSKHAVRAARVFGRGRSGPVRSAVRAVRVRARGGRQVLGAAGGGGRGRGLAAAPEGREHRRELRAAAAVVQGGR